MGRATRRDLFVAVVSAVLTALLLGGGAAVAFNVPNNSVNSAKIVDNSVRTGDLRNGTIADADLSPETRTYWAIVHVNSGTPSIIADEGATNVTVLSTGRYGVTWAVDVSDCAVQATLHTNGFTSPPAGSINTMHVVSDPHTIETRTFNASGTLAHPVNATGFTISVNC